MHVVCLSVFCDVLYCGETAHPSQKLSEEANRVTPGDYDTNLDPPFIPYGGLSRIKDFACSHISDVIFVILSRDSVNIYMQSSKGSFSRNVVNLAPAVPHAVHA